MSADNETFTKTIHLGHSEKIEMGDDTDGLDMFEVRFKDDKNKIVESVLFRREDLPALRRATREWERDMDARSAPEPNTEDDA